MIDWNALINRKYNILQQNADTQRMGITAAANLDNTRAGLLPAESRANIANTTAQAGLYGSQARNIDEETKMVVPLAKAQILESGARGLNYRAQAANTSADTVGISQINRHREANGLTGSGLGGMYRTSDPLKFRERVSNWVGGL